MMINSETVAALLEIKKLPLPGYERLLSLKATAVLDELRKKHEITAHKPLIHCVVIELSDALVSAATTIQTLKKANATYKNLMGSVRPAGTRSQVKEILALQKQVVGSLKKIRNGEEIIRALSLTKLTNVDQFLEMIEKLHAWVSEVPDKEVEFEARKTAAEQIKALFLSEEVSDLTLDLSHLELTSLPDIFSHPIFNLVIFIPPLSTRGDS